MKLGVAEIMKNASEKPNHREKIDYLRTHDSDTIRVCFRLAYDVSLVWDFPEGWRPDYKKNIYMDQEATLYQAVKHIGKFLVDGYPGLTAEKKQTLFVQLLEGVTPLDAELLIAMKDKKIPWKGLGRAVVREAYPGLLPQPEEEAREA